MPPVRSPFSRVFTIEDRAGPANVPVYLGEGRAMGPSWGFGDRTPIRKPDPNRYGAFTIIDAIKAERGLPALSIENRYQYTISDFLRMARRGCAIDLQVHFGQCQDPRDFNGGWDKILVLEGADFSNFNTNEMGAVEQGEDAVVNETVDFNGLDLYEILKVSFAELAGTEVIGEVVAVTICDSVTCGECGLPSTGCQHVFAITITQTGSPGLPAELIYSIDGGDTIGETNVSTLGPTEDPSGMACVGTNLAIVSNDSCSIHYAPIADIEDGTEVWTAIATGLTCAAGAPNAIFSMGSRFTWIVGDGGYIYFTADITAGATDTQDAGVATTEDLQDIHGFDELNLVAVGDNNAVVFTTNGGETWASITGPAVGIVLNTVWMKSADEWFVGSAAGNLYYTRNAGTTWTTKAFPGSAAGQVRDIVFATPTVGYLAHDTAAAAGRILRTVDGGQSWYVLPEGTGAIPTNDRVNSLAACGEDVNIVYGGGLAGDATDGFLVKASA